MREIITESTDKYIFAILFDFLVSRERSTMVAEYIAPSARETVREIISFLLPITYVDEQWV